MVCKIEFLPIAARQYRKLPVRVKSRILVELETIGENPYLGKRLKGEYEGKMSYRVGGYRIVYKILKSKKVVEIHKIGHRREVY
ncbi:MAG: type II toxin-antitoxin system RelE/ParE family toxin [Firmicutes bacterium]|nr:type II toxin-antitoxin system RelE/ParE family toxin [Bacillota bacterium]